jgi:hypothetical protein
MVLSTVVPTSFTGVDSFDKTRCRIIAGCPSLSLWETITGGRGYVLPFDLIAQHQTEIVVMSSVVPISLASLDSFDQQESDPVVFWTSFVSKYGYYPSYLPSITGHQPISPSCLVP